MRMIKIALVASLLAPAVSFAGDAPAKKDDKAAATTKTDAAKKDDKAAAKTDAKTDAKTPAKKDAAKDASKPATK